MNPLFAISVCCTSLFCLSIGLLVLSSNKKSATNITYFLITLATFLWLYSVSFLYTTENYQNALLLGKIKYMSVAFIPVFFYHFLVTFLEIKDSRQKVCLYFFYAASLTFVTLIWFSPFMIDGLYKYYWGMYPRGGIFSSLFVLYFIAIFFYCLAMLFFYYRTNRSSFSHIRLLQIKWIFVSFFLSSFAMPDFLPYFGVNYRPLGHIAISLFLLTNAYSIVRYRVMDIEVIIKKTLIFSGLFISAYTIFAFFALLSQVLFERYIIENRWVSLIPSVFVVTIMLRPLENFLVTVTDKYLFQKKYDYKELLKTFMSEVLTVLEIDKLVMLTKEKLEKTMKLEYCGIIMTNKYDKNIVYNSEIKLKIPITLNDKAIGALLLGKKKSDEEYTKDDIDILQSLTKALGIAISNAKLFDELARTQVEMTQKDKMATVGTLAAGMAHEILNPITTIRVFSEYVPDRFKDTEFTDKYKDIVVKEVDKIDHIIQALIDFSGDDSEAEIEMVSLEESIDELISLIGLNKDMLDKIDFIKEIPINISKIRINRKEFDEILLNLTQNAMHAIEGKGRITFKAEEKNEFVELNIIDTGCGMSDDIAKNIFNPFFTTRSEGFGLGLFVVKQLVKRNGGDISVESKAGKGTEFSLMFKKG